MIRNRAAENQSMARARRVLADAGVTRVIVESRMVMADSAVGNAAQASNFAAALAALSAAGIRFGVDPEYPNVADLV